MVRFATLIRRCVVCAVAGTLLVYFAPWWTQNPLFLFPIIGVGLIAGFVLSGLDVMVRSSREVRMERSGRDLAAGEPFDCSVCTFTLPVAAHVDIVSVGQCTGVSIALKLEGCPPSMFPTIRILDLMPEMLWEDIDRDFEKAVGAVSEVIVSDWEPCPECGPGAMTRRVSPSGDRPHFRATVAGDRPMAWTVVASGPSIDAVYKRVRELADMISCKVPPSDQKAPGDVRGTRKR